MLQTSDRMKWEHESRMGINALCPVHTSDSDHGGGAHAGMSSGTGAS